MTLLSHQRATASLYAPRTSEPPILRIVRGRPTEAELAVLSLLAQGYTQKDIAAQLGIGKSTVQNRLERCAARCKVGNLTQLLILAGAEKWVRLESESA